MWPPSIRSCLFLLLGALPATLCPPAMVSATCSDYSQYRRTLGWIDTPGQVTDLLVPAGDPSLLYALDATGALLVIDLHDPAAAVISYQRDTPPGAEGLAQVGERLLLASPWGIHVFDITDPRSPTLSDSLEVPGGCTRVSARADLAVTAGGDSTLSVVGMGGELTLLARVRLPAAITDVALEQDLAAASLGAAGVQIIDVTDPHVPRLRGIFDYDWEVYGLGDLGDHRDVVWHGGALYVLFLGQEDCGGDRYYNPSWMGLLFVSVADPDAPVRTGQLALARELPYRPRMHVVGDTWSVPTREGMVALKAGASAPVLESAIGLPISPSAAVAENGIICAPGAGSGLLVHEGLATIEPEQAAMAGSYRLVAAKGDLLVETIIPYEAWTFRVLRSDTLGRTCTLYYDYGNAYEIGEPRVTCIAPPYLARDYDGSYQVIKFPDGCPDRPPYPGCFGCVSATLPAPVYDVVADRAVAIQQLTPRSILVQLFDVSALPEFSLGGQLENAMTSPWSPWSWHCWHHGDLFFLIDTDNFLVLDTGTGGDPSPVFWGAPPPGDFAAQEDDRLYMLRDGGLDLYDIADPAAPVLLSSFTGSSAALAATVFDRILYARTAAGILAIDWREATSPLPLGTILRRTTWGTFAALPGGLYWAGREDCLETCYYRAPLACASYVPAAVSYFEVSPRDGRLRIDWGLAAAPEESDLRLTVSCDGRQRELAFTSLSNGGYHAECGMAEACPVGADLSRRATLTCTLWLRTADGWSSMAERTVEMSPGSTPPRAAGLLGVRPNPFNPRTEIAFALPRPLTVRLTVHDLAGRVVATLADRPYPAGRHVVSWEGADGRGRPLPAGNYLVRMVTAQGTSTRKVTLLK